MGRGQVRNSSDPGPPQGREWGAFRRMLFAEHGNAPLCYHCGHVVPGPSRGEIQHLLSPRTHPQLAWARRNLRFTHAGGAKRCPVCDLSCQSISASNVAPRDSTGRPLPFAPDFLAAKVAERKARVNRPGPAERAPRVHVSATVMKPDSTAAAPARPRIDVNVGRPW
jgi:hypothetical protein